MTNKLTIFRYYFTASDCYRAGKVQQPQGVQVHSTGANNPWLRRYVGPDDGQLGRNQYGNHSNQSGGDVCASAYIGRLADGTVAVYQVLPWTYRCWLSGSAAKGNANREGYIGFEICEDGLHDEQYFNEAMKAAILLTGHLCDLMGVMPDEAGPCGKVVMDHRQLHAAGYASNHGDVLHWLKLYNRNMDDFRKDVKAAMIEGIEVEYIDRSPTQEQTPTLRLGAKGDDVLRMQTLLIAHGADIVADGIFGRATKVAVETFQTSHGLKVDGICGPVTWTALRVEPPRAGILLDDLKDMVEDLETDTSGVDVPAIDIPPVEPIEPPETKPTSVCVAISSEIRAVTQILYSEFMDKLNEETDKILKKYERI